MIRALRRVIAQALTPPVKPLPYPTDEMLADALGLKRVELVQTDTVLVPAHTRKKPSNPNREAVLSDLRALREQARSVPTEGQAPVCSRVAG